MSKHIDNLNEQAWELRSSNVSEALRLAEKACTLASKEHYNAGIAASLLTKSYCQFRHSDYKNALENADKALEMFEASESKADIQRSLNTLGIIHGQSGDLTSALKTFLRAHKLCEDLGDKEAEANALNNLAIIYVYFGDYTTALDYYLKSLNIYQELKALQGEVKTLQNVGVVYFEMGRYQNALEYFQKSLEISDTLNDTHTYALTLSNIGRAHHKLNEHDTALKYQHDSLKLMEGLQDKSGISDALVEIGRTHLNLDNLQEAEAYLQQSLDIKSEVGDRKGHAETCLYLGALFSKQTDYKRAAELFETALVTAEEISAKAEMYRAHEGLANALKGAGQLEAAFTHLNSYVRIKDEMFNAASDQRFQALRVGYEVEQTEKEAEIYRLRSVELARMNDKLQILTEQLERQAKEDPLTTLYNRRHFDAVLEEAYSKSQRYGNPMSVMICDIDNFKRVNDTFSHAVGDEVLVRVAQIFKDTIRESDTVARYGGEEFVVLYPETLLGAALPVCERLRSAVENHPWHEVHAELHVTISVGVCDDTTLGSGETMVARADDKLYEVKRNGKNHIKVWEPVEGARDSSEPVEVVA